MRGDAISTVLVGDIGRGKAKQLTFLSSLDLLHEIRLVRKPEVDLL
jgi:hypothetical protein